VGKPRFVAGRKHGEPQDRQQGETDLHGRGGANRRGGEKPRGRYAEREASRSRREARQRAARASDSSASDDGGAIFGQPQERKSDRTVGSHGSGRDGKAGVKVRRVAQPCSRMRTHPGRRDLVGPGVRAEGRGGERRSRAPRNRPGPFPRGGPHTVARHPAKDAAARFAPPPLVSWARERSFGPAVRGRRVEPQGSASALKTRRTTCPPVRNGSLPRGGGPHSGLRRPPRGVPVTSRRGSL
jgi:hypothetical protein